MADKNQSNNAQVWGTLNLHGKEITDLQDTRDSHSERISILARTADDDRLRANDRINDLNSEVNNLKRAAHHGTSYADVCGIREQIKGLRADLNLVSQTTVGLPSDTEARINRQIQYLDLQRAKQAKQIELLEKQQEGINEREAYDYKEINKLKNGLAVRDERIAALTKRVNELEKPAITFEIPNREKYNVSSLHKLVNETLAKQRAAAERQLQKDISIALHYGMGTKKWVANNPPFVSTPDAPGIRNLYREMVQKWEKQIEAKKYSAFAEYL